jgi:dihydroorotase
MSELVTPHVALGGIQTAYVMVSSDLLVWLRSLLTFSSAKPQPNLIPPITTTERAMEYKAQLETIDPKVEYLMTLYLHENMLEEIDVEGQKTLRGVEEVRKASKAGVKGAYEAGSSES